MFIDNKAVVFTLQHGRIKDLTMPTIVRSVWLIVASRDIYLEYVHILGAKNTLADTLSRIFECNCNECQLKLTHNHIWWPVHSEYFYPR